jgi:hypothetical protein
MSGCSNKVSLLFPNRKFRSEKPSVDICHLTTTTKLNHQSNLHSISGMLGNIERKEISNGSLNEEVFMEQFRQLVCRNFHAFIANGNNFTSN